MSMSGDKVRIALGWLVHLTSVTGTYLLGSADFVCVPRGVILYTFYRYARGE